MECDFMSLGLPVIIKNDAQYKEKLRECFQEYNRWVDNFAAEELPHVLALSNRADLHPDWNNEKTEIQTIEKDILDAIDDYYSGKISEAQSIICELISRLLSLDELDFLVSDIDRSYSTRLVAPFPTLHNPIIGDPKEYEIMNTVPLSFFRGRTGRIESHEDMLHIPLDKRDSVKTQRFSVPGTPCLYLGTSSYNIWRELGHPPFDKFNVSTIRLKPISERRSIKILNLVSSLYFDWGLIAIPHQQRITGQTIALLLMQLKIWPLVCATSFKVKNSAGFFHSEYIISHLIMLNLPKLKIDGVAYVSKQIEPQEEAIALPLMLNIAIPVISAQVDCLYGDICSDIEITDPVNLQEFQGIELEMESLPKQCYFCRALNRGNLTPDLIYAKRAMKYRKTTFFRLDNFLCNQQFYSYDINNHKWSISKDRTDIETVANRA